MAYSSLEIANEFLKLAQRDNASLTQMQLQKLVYLAHGYFLADNGEPLVEDAVEAWDYGTVFPKLREATKQYGKEPVAELISWGDGQLFSKSPKKVASAALSAKARDVIERVWSAYGKFPAFKLSALTHDRDGPWAEAYVERENRVIPDSAIRKYFRSLRAKNASRRTA